MKNIVAAIIVAVAILTTTGIGHVSAASEAEKLYERKIANKRRAQTISSDYYKAMKYYGSLQGSQRDSMTKKAQRELLKDDKDGSGQERIDKCERKYYDSLRRAACIGVPKG